MKTRFSSPLFAFASRGLFGLALLALVPVVACTSPVEDPASDDDASDSEAQDLKKKPKTKKTSCESVFGTCVGLSPSACVGGTWADARTVTCGGGIGVGCCVKPTPPPPPPPPSECPELVPPAPGFCPGGQTVAVHDPETGCLVGFDCVQNAQTACEARGGQCVGLAPQSCPSGHWGPIDTHGCGPGIGVGCCLP